MMMMRRRRELIFLRLRLIIVQIGASAVVDGNFGFAHRLQDVAARDFVFFVTDRERALHLQTAGSSTSLMTLWSTTVEAAVSKTCR